MFPLKANYYSHKGANEILQQKTLLDEIREIAESVTDIDHKKIQGLFKERKWFVKGKQVKVLEDSQYSYDAFKQNVAVEIELSQHGLLFKDYFKFLIGHHFGKVDVAVLFVRNVAYNVANPYFSFAKKDIQRFTPLLPVPILLIGIGET